jgi:hypothetical protein
MVIPPPTPPTLFLRGTFNGWDASNRMQYADGNYRASQALPAAAPVSFKFGSADWSESYGFYGLVYDASQPGAQPSSTCTDDGTAYGNIQFVPPAAATYEFDFNYARKTFWIR